MKSMSIGIPVRTAGTAVRDLTIELHRDMGDLEPLWREFERRATCTVFQTYRWLSTWFATVGGTTGVEPAIMCARDAAGVPVLILPFGITTHRGTRILGWLGGEHANYQFGLFAPDWLDAIGPADFEALWHEIVAALPAFDLLCFADQPEAWDGRTNPFVHLPHLPSANRSHVLHLAADYETLYAAKRSSSTRRSARKRDKRLEQDGLVEFCHPTTPREIAAALATLFSQKIPHMESIGVGDVYGPAFPDFLVALAPPAGDEPSPLDIRCLTCGGETIATVLGAVGKGRYYGLILSMTDGPLRRHSPGELALRRTIEACCAMGLGEFDLSQGEAAYKAAWADDQLAQFDTLIAYTAKGHAYAAVARLTLTAKRHIKQSPRLLAAANALRKGLLGRNSHARSERS
jgi:CelD/BcsL family acetyltransferase involved in cellulose biosynthesis